MSSVEPGEESSSDNSSAETGIPVDNLVEATAGETVQDFKREKLLRELFGLIKPVGSGRSGTDAELHLAGGVPIPFELKSATTQGITTARDVGPEHVRKWRGKHWLIGFFDPSGTNLVRCLYASPKQLEPWISKIEAYIKPDFDLAKLPPRVARELYEEVLVANLGDKEIYTLEDARRLHKKQFTTKQYLELMDRDLPASPGVPGAKRKTVLRGYSRERMLAIMADRWTYLTKRGATLNNPHINPADYKDFTELTTSDPATAQKALRRVVADALTA